MEIANVPIDGAYPVHIRFDLNSFHASFLPPSMEWPILQRLMPNPSIPSPPLGNVVDLTAMNNISFTPEHENRHKWCTMLREKAWML
jgi:hypothetical protein